MSDQETRPREPGDGPRRRGGQRDFTLYLRPVFSEARQPLPPDLADAPLWVTRRLDLGREGEDLALAWDDWASRHHCAVSRFRFGQERGLLVEDLGASNGTFLDGERVEGSIVAKVGQVLRVGSTLFVVGEAPRARVDAITDKGPPPPGWHARTWSMLQLWDRARAVAATDDPLLLLGEPGTGKTRLARHVHLLSARAEGPFVPMNCSAIPHHLEEATLFGVVGGFIPTVKEKRGLLTAAQGGTLFLDELADMPALAQTKLLDAFDPAHQSYLPVGGTTRMTTDCRLICATNQDVFDLAARGELRHDFLSRLVVAQLTVPPLRERREDLLAIYWDAVARLNLASADAELSVEAAEAMLLAHWTENVRGLESFARRLAHGTEPTPEAIRAHAERGRTTASQPAPGAASAPQASPLPAAPTAETVRWPPTELEWFALLEAHHWNLRAIARALDMRRETIGRALTRTFGKGGKKAAQRAFKEWQKG